MMDCKPVKWKLEVEKHDKQASILQFFNKKINLQKIVDAFMKF